MKVYAGTFKKKNGEHRNMLFARLKDLPPSFLDEVVTGAGNERQYPDGMELVWDIEEDNFRVFNWNTVVEDPTVTEKNIEDNFK